MDTIWEWFSETVFGTLSSPLAKYRYPTDRQHFRLGCGFEVSRPLPRVAPLRALYQNAPSTIWQYDPETVGSWTVALRELRRYFHPAKPLSVLDVGAFEGVFFSGLPSAWHAVAVETSQVGRSALTNQGIEVIPGFVEEFADRPQVPTFDVVTPFHVF